jgi:uncharacterized membrane protein
VSQYARRRDRLVPSILTTGLALGGFAASLYGLVQHYSPTAPMVCSAGSAIPVNCPAVTPDIQSTVIGVPIALLSSVFFLVILSLCLPMAWRTSLLWIHVVRMAMATGGAGFLAYLIDVETPSFDEHSLGFIVSGAVTLALFAIIFVATTTILSEGRRFGSAVRPLPTMG